MSRLVKRPRVDHAKTAAELRAAPGTWRSVGEYRSSQSAEHMAYAVRTAWSKTKDGSPYAPAGSFQAKTRLTEYGAELYIRYVGWKGGRS